MQFTSDQIKRVHTIARRAKARYGMHYHCALSFAFKAIKQKAGQVINGITIVNIKGRQYRKVGDTLHAMETAYNMSAVTTFKIRSKTARSSNRRRQVDRMQGKTNGKHVERYQSNLIPKYGLMDEFRA